MVVTVKKLKAMLDKLPSEMVAGVPVSFRTNEGTIEQLENPAIVLKICIEESKSKNSFTITPSVIIENGGPA